VTEPRVLQEAAGSTKVVVANQHPAGQNSERSFEDAHILIEHEMRYGRAVEQRFDRGNQD